MTHITSIAALTLCIAASVAACGGGGSDGTASPGSDNGTDAPAEAGGEFSGTAYLRTQATGRIPGEDFGLIQLHTKGLIGDCNWARKAMYDSDPSPAIAPAVLASVDVSIEEKYFDNGTRAASYSSGHVLVLSDFYRWLEESKSSTNPPATPPDCSVYKLVPTASGTLWMDGLRYTLDTEKRTATAQRRATDFEPVDLVAAEEAASWPREEVAGQHCKVSSVQVDSIGPGDCIWERFPVVKKYLNWPWVMRSDFNLGESNVEPGRRITLDLTTNRALPEDRLRIPDGYTVVGP